MIVAVTLETVAQLTANGIIAGAAYGLLGVGFALILGVTGRFHFAYGLTYTPGAYLVFWFYDRVGLPYWPAVGLGIVAVTVFGVGIERVVYRPLAARAGATALLAIFVASLGLGIAGENLIRLLWGSQTHALLGLDQSVIQWWEVIFLNYDVYQVLSATALVVALTLVLRYTAFGRMIKATRSNPDMAQILGINPRTVYLIVFAIGTAFSGVAAYWSAVKFSVEPSMGFKPVVFAFVVAFLAGTARSPIRIFLVGITVSLVEQLSSIWLSTRWTQTAVFVILVLYLVWKAADVRTLMLRFQRQAQVTVDAVEGAGA